MTPSENPDGRMIDKAGIGRRLKQFGEKEFGSLSVLAAKLDMTPQALHRYLIGASAPGSNILSKLISLGCDVEWLLTGKPGNQEGLSYVPIEETETGAEVKTIEHTQREAHGFSLPLLGKIPAGRAEFQSWQENNETFHLSFNPFQEFILTIDEEFGYSMMPLVNPGDKILVTMHDRPKSGDLVAALWDKTKGALKVLIENQDMPGIISLHSYNTAIPPMIFKAGTVKLYKVKAVFKS